MGWLVSEHGAGERQIQSSGLMSRGTKGWQEEGNQDGLEDLQTTLETSALTLKSSTTTTRNRSKFKILDDIMEMAAAAANCRDLETRKVLRKRGEAGSEEI